MTVPNTRTAAAPNNRNEIVVCKTCVPFTNCVREVNNSQIDDAHDTDVVILTDNLIEHSDIYSKTSGSLQEYYRDKLALDGNGIIIDFPVDNNNNRLELHRINTARLKNQNVDDNA